MTPPKKKAKAKKAPARKKTPRRRKASPKKGESTGRLTLDALNDRQKGIRQHMLDNAGQCDTTALARQYRVDRTTIWRDRQIIGRVRTHVPKWDEQAAIDEAVAYYQNKLDYLLAELEHIHDGEIQVRNQGGLRSQTGKVALLNVMATVRRDYNNFLMDVGLIRRAPTQIQISEGELEGLKTTSSIVAAIAEVRREAAALRKMRTQAEKG